MSMEQLKAVQMCLVALERAHEAAKEAGLHFKKFVLEDNTAFFSTADEEFPGQWCSLFVNLDGDDRVRLDVVSQGQILLDREYLVPADFEEALRLVEGFGTEEGEGLSCQPVVAVE